MNILGYNLGKAKRFHLAIVGYGPVLDLFGRLLTLEDFGSAFPYAKITGWVPVADESAGMPPVPKFLEGIPVFQSIQSLFAARTRIHIAVDVTPDSCHMGALREHAPLSTSLCTSEMLVRFCAATEDGRLALGGGENLRKAHKLVALLVDQLDGDILILDAQGRIVDVNQHTAASRGVPRSQLIGMHCADLAIGNKSCCKDNSGCCPFVEAKNSQKQFETTFTRVGPDDRMHYVHAVCTPVTDALGDVSAYLLAMRDITEQQHIEHRLQQAEKMAAIGELSTYMAHEIRNPVFSIGGFANALLRNPSLNDLAREKARIIYDESRRLDGILANLLNFARPTEQLIDDFDAARVACQTLELMTLGSEGRGITTKAEFEPNLPKAVGNAENLKQSLINIIKNAFEAMPEGGVLTFRMIREKEFLRIDVGDTGDGIPLELQEEIFSPFFTTKHSGAGLGLALTKKVIEEMSGKVTLESLPGQGTVVTLRIPVALALAGNRTNTPPVEADPE